jgi:nicotinate dehydrogenase subunit B
MTSQASIADWLHIDADGRITAFTGKAEVGQNVRTSLAQAVADELRLPVERVRLVMSDTVRVPYDRGTFGSRSTPDMAVALRRAAAAAREALLDLACELTRGAPLAQPVPLDAPVTPPAQWTMAGRSAPKANAASFVTGTHRYASDVVRPGMRYGKVLRPAGFGAQLVSLDTTAAEAMPGVAVVREGDFVGVVAPSSALAAQALSLIRAEWRVPDQPSSEGIFEYLKTHPAQEATRQGPGGSAFTTGSVEAALAAAARVLEQTYTTAYIAHAPLEPRAAVAEWGDGGRTLTVWTGTQRPFGVRDQLVETFGLPPERVRVIVPDTGAGYGGKHTGEAAIEAARLARAAGVPVKVVWTREEEMTWAYFRPAARIDLRAALDAGGTLTAWECHVYNAGTAAMRTPYDVPNQHIEYHPAASPLRQGSYRALAATANLFARESFMDELAHAAGVEPLRFRIRHCSDRRLLAVLEAAAERFGWGGPKPPHHGFGLAGGTEKGSYVATCAEVAVDPQTGAVRLVRVVETFECGAIVNPDHLRNQVEGAIVQAIGGAFYEQVEFAGGRILNPRFSQYRVPRFGDVPKIEVVLLDRKDLPSAGAGETPLIGLAPAAANAIYDATGVRLRSLPMLPRGVLEPAARR